ncbi:hypothetical protein [Streptomyces sp. NPDC049879]|uniref:hypothetical protein n=1 Tax=Streptomyces sp. NPDC049879 TaxID=3365598 RepID=UPI00378BAC50
MAVVVAVGTLTACGSGHGHQSVLFPASERPESRSPAGDVPLTGAADAEEVLARANRVAEALTSVHQEVEVSLDGAPASMTVDLRNDQDGSCDVHFRRGPTQVIEVLRERDESWFRVDAGTLDEMGAPPSLVGKWFHSSGEGGQEPPLVELCDTDAAGSVTVLPENATALTMTPLDGVGHVEISWRHIEEGVETLSVARITTDGSDRLVGYETSGELPSVGTIRYLGSWSEFDEPVEVTPPDPGSVVEFDDLAEELGDLPSFGEGIIPAAYTDEPG